MEMSGAGKLLIILGLILVVAGLITLLSGKLPFIGKLPGDIVIKKPGFTFYFPVVTFLLLSLILTIIFNAVLRLWHR